ncbi:HD-GYP domain-containing protein [Desulfovibrio sp. JC010]|uniref:HD-GYP domain-containing protein n=1 Tax=Desulfovibrio sp. JC010 TaxID=2593641 RepID=UPI0013D0FA86|nr:HD domain-containing phosphohydrolase [Desulfovibrio sp. JC010]NDV25042.1 HD domain-containing protein [Desulfovibrio sp. JC010]
MNTGLNPETRLKRIIKPKKLRAFLGKALPLLPENSVLCVYIDGTPIFCAEPICHSFEETILSPVKNPSGDNLCLGAFIQNRDKLCEPELNHIKSVLEFTAFSISNYIESETARRLIGEETLSKYRELALLHRSIVELNNSLRLKDVITALTNECKTSALPAEMGAVYLPEEEGFTIFDSFGNFSADELENLVECTLFKDIIASLRGEIINDVSKDDRCRDKLSGNIRSMLIMPIPSPNVCEGVLVLTSPGMNAFNAAHLKHVSTLSSVAGISISNAYNFESIRVLMDALLKALAEAIDARDPFTAGHSERVAHLAVSFARQISQDNEKFKHIDFTDEQLREIFYSGILHDIGKIGIKEEVLTKKTRLPKSMVDVIGMRLKLFGIHHMHEWEDDYKRIKQINSSLSPAQDDLDFVDSMSSMKFKVNGSTIHMLHPDERECLTVRRGNLTAEERMEIERHPAESKRILEHIPFQDDLSQLLTIIGQHHERLDGSGYPEGLAGDEILIQSRILAIVDIYDAITQERHYKPATPQERALKILALEAGEGKLDSTLVDLFINNISEIENGAESIDLDRPVSTRFCKIPRGSMN